MAAVVKLQVICTVDGTSHRADLRVLKRGNRSQVFGGEQVVLRLPVALHSVRLALIEHIPVGNGITFNQWKACRLKAGCSFFNRFREISDCSRHKFRPFILPVPGFVGLPLPLRNAQIVAESGIQQDNVERIVIRFEFGDALPHPVGNGYIIALKPVGHRLVVGFGTVMDNPAAVIALPLHHLGDRLLKPVAAVHLVQAIHIKSDVEVAKHPRHEPCLTRYIVIYGRFEWNSVGFGKIMGLVERPDHLFFTHHTCERVGVERRNCNPSLVDKIVQLFELPGCTPLVVHIEHPNRFNGPFEIRIPFAQCDHIVENLQVDFPYNRLSMGIADIGVAQEHQVKLVFLLRHEFSCNCSYSSCSCSKSISGPD